MHANSPHHHAWEPNRWDPTWPWPAATWPTWRLTSMSKRAKHAPRCAGCAAGSPGGRQTGLHLLDRRRYAWAEGNSWDGILGGGRRSFIDSG